MNTKTTTGLTMIDNLWVVKAAGAAIGSSIAVVFRPGGDTTLKLFQRFVIGVILGVIFCPMIMDYFEWKPTREYWLAAATLGGLFSYLALHVGTVAILTWRKKKDG